MVQYTIRWRDKAKRIIEVEDEIRVCFTPRGTVKEYERTIDSQKIMEYEYKGLILVNQGYVITLIN
ncbi:MAG: hypothetical protein SNG14_08520 [Rikenellaceae bacterium]